LRHKYPLLHVPTNALHGLKQHFNQKNQTATTKPNGASNCCNSVIFIDAD